MKLNIQTLYEVQDELDSRIFDNHHVDRPSTYIDRMLALLVEIAECANETRCFKFWSVKKASDQEVIAQEYVDGIHFLLSLGIDLDMGVTEIESVELDSTLSDQFIGVFEAVIALSKNFSEENYEKAFAVYLGIACKLGLSAETITQHYQDKNKTNHKRQDENY